MRARTSSRSAAPAAAVSHKAQRREQRERNLRAERRRRALRSAVRELRTEAASGGARHRTHLCWQELPVVADVTDHSIEEARRRHPASRLQTARTVAPSRIVPGAVVRAQVPYADGERWKTRPAAVLTRVGREVELLPISSSDRAVTFGPAVADLRAAGLHRRSAFVARVVRVDLLAVVEVLGTLAGVDAVTVDDLTARVRAAAS